MRSQIELIRSTIDPKTSTGINLRFDKQNQKPYTVNDLGSKIVIDVKRQAINTLTFSVPGNPIKLSEIEIYGVLQGNYNRLDPKFITTRQSSYRENPVQNNSRYALHQLIDPYYETRTDTGAPSFWEAHFAKPVQLQSICFSAGSVPLTDITVTFLDFKGQYIDSSICYKNIIGGTLEYGVHSDRAVSFMRISSKSPTGLTLSNVNIYLKDPFIGDSGIVEPLFVTDANDSLTKKIDSIPEQIKAMDSRITVRKYRATQNDSNNAAITFSLPEKKTIKTIRLLTELKQDGPDPVTLSVELLDEEYKPLKTVTVRIPEVTNYGAAKVGTVKNCRYIKISSKSPKTKKFIIDDLLIEESN